MSKIFFLALKDFRITFRDRAAVLIMFALPLGLTLISFFAFGDEDPVPESIPVVFVNQDEGELGEELINVYQSVDLADLFSPQIVSTEAEARQAVNQDQAAAAVLIPEDFTSILYTHAISESTSELIIVTNPTRTISAAVVQAVAGRFIEIVNTSTIGAEAYFASLMATGRISSSDITEMGPDVGMELGTGIYENELVSIEILEPFPTEEDVFSFKAINYLEYYASSMAVMGLMFSLTSASRTILAERESGTLARYQTTPSTNTELIGGKVISAILTGCFQMTVLVVITTLLLDASWGSPIPLSVFTFFIVAAIASMGLLIAAFARSHAQAGILGTVVTLVLSAASGNFLPRQAFPQWLQTISAAGPSAWGIEGYQALANGAGLPDLGIHILALSVMTLVFFILSLYGLRRQVL